MAENALTIRVCKHPIVKGISKRFHCLIFDPKLNPEKSEIELVKELMKTFKNRSGIRCEEQAMETPLSPEQLAQAIEKNVTADGLKFEIRQVAGNPNIIAEFYAETTDNELGSNDILNFIVMHEESLQTQVKVESKSTKTLEFRRM